MTASMMALYPMMRSWSFFDMFHSWFNFDLCQDDTPAGTFNGNFFKGRLQFHSAGSYVLSKMSGLHG